MRRGHVLRLPAALGVAAAGPRAQGRDAILRREALALVALVAASLAWKAAFAWSGSPERVVDSPWLHSLPAYLDQFALGMGLAVLTLWRPPSARVLPAAGILLARLAFWAVSVRIGIGYQLFEPYTRWQYLGRHLLYAAVGDRARGRRRSARTPARGVGRALGNAPMRFLGTISFGIYLWHVSVFEALKRTGALDELTWHPFLVQAGARPRDQLGAGGGELVRAGAPAAAERVASVAAGSACRLRRRDHPTGQ